MNYSSLFFKRFFSLFFLVSISIEPFAMAFEKVQLNDKLLREFLKDSGLGRSDKLTMGEFFKNAEKHLPERILKPMRPWFKAHATEKMPIVEIATFTDQDGSQKYRFNFTKNGETATVAFFGEDQRFVRVNSVPLILEDVLKFTPMVERLRAHIPQFRGEGEGSEIIPPPATISKGGTLGDLAPTVGSFVMPTREALKKMTPLEKAQVLVHLRSLMAAAEEAQFYFNQTEATKSSKSKKGASYNPMRFDQYFVAALLGQVAQAAGTGAQIPLLGADKACIDSGFSDGESTLLNIGGKKRWKCVSPQAEGLVKTYRENATKGVPNSIKAQSSCASVCNPEIYGIKDDGFAYCTTAATRNNATHWEGGCESQMHLAQSKAPADIEIDPKKFNDENYEATLRKQLAPNDSDAKFNLEQSKKLVASLLKLQGIDGGKFSDLLGGKGNNDQIQKFESVVNGFYTSIKTSLMLCSNINFNEKVIAQESPDKKLDPSLQLNACRQLFRRKIAFDVSMDQLCKDVKKASFSGSASACTTVLVPQVPPPAKDCPKNSTPTGNQCVCDDGNDKGKAVEKGGSCNGEPKLTPAQCVSPAEAIPGNPKKCKCNGTEIDIGAKCEPTIKSGSAACNIKQAEFLDWENFNSHTCQCQKPSTMTRLQQTDEGKFYCILPSGKLPGAAATLGSDGFWKKNKGWLEPTLYVGVPLLGFYLLNQRNKRGPSPKNTDLCPTTTQVCPGGVSGNQCTAPLVYNTSTSSCYLSCPPGSSPDYTKNVCTGAGTTALVCSTSTVGACYCNGILVASNASCTTSTTTYTCTDGRVVASQSLCKYTCPSGVIVESPSMCPTVQKIDDSNVLGSRRKLIKGKQ